MKTPSRWSRLKKGSQRLAFALAALVTLTALALAIEGYRAKRAWEACHRELGARGEALDWQAHVAAPVDPQHNMLAAPVLAACFGFDTTSGNLPQAAQETSPCTELEHLGNLAPHLPAVGDWRSGTVVSLAEWQRQLRSTNSLEGLRWVWVPGARSDEQLVARYGKTNRVMQRPGTRNGLEPSREAVPGQYGRPEHPPEQPRAAAPLPPWADLWSRPPASAIDDLRFLLGRHQAELDEIRAAARRPVAQLRLDAGVLSESLMARLGLLKGLARPFWLSAWTELNAGEPETAAADIETVLAFSDAASSQPLLIGALVRIALVELAVQPIWAGLAERRWEDAQLARLGARLEQVNIVADVQRCLRGERAFILAMMTAAPDSGDPQPGLAEDAMRQVLRKWPRAFVLRNQSNIARAHQQLLLEPLDAEGPSVRLQQTQAQRAVRERYGSFSPYNVFTPALLPALEVSLAKAAASQVTVTLARVAIALERHRLATGRYPEILDELTPRFLVRLPPDPVNGGLLGYRRDAPDRFTLYSVGLNEKDDGGVPSVPVHGSFGARAPAGDWVWRSHATDTDTRGR